MEKQCEECGLMNTEGCNTCGVLNPVMKITVMPPTVVNVNNVTREVPSENVASDGETPIDDVNLDYQREDGK